MNLHVADSPDDVRQLIRDGLARVAQRGWRGVVCTNMALLAQSCGLRATISLVYACRVRSRGAWGNWETRILQRSFSVRSA